MEDCVDKCEYIVVSEALAGLHHFNSSGLSGNLRLLKAPDPSLCTDAFFLLLQDLCIRAKQSNQATYGGRKAQPGARQMES